MAQRMCARMSTRLSRLYVQATEPNSKGRYHRLYDILHLLPRYYLLLKLKWSSHCIVSALQLSNIYDLALALPSAMVLQHMLITLSTDTLSVKNVWRSESYCRVYLPCPWWHYNLLQRSGQTRKNYIIHIARNRFSSIAQHFNMMFVVWLC